MLCSNGDQPSANKILSTNSKTICLVGNSKLYNTELLMSDPNGGSLQKSSNSAPTSSKSSNSDISSLVTSVSGPQLLLSSLVSAQATLKNCAQSLSLNTTTRNSNLERLPPTLQDLRRNQSRSNGSFFADTKPVSRTSHSSNSPEVTNSLQHLIMSYGPATSPKQNNSSKPPSSTNIGPQGSGGTVSARLLDMGKRLLDAARLGNTDSVRKLVVSSGAPFTSDWLGTTALHQAAMHGHLEIAEILLRGGVNRDARTKIDRTALHLAAQSGSTEVVELLLHYGSDVNARDMLKMTPLHWAVERNHLLVSERLLLAGADTRARSKFNLTPLEMALNSGSFELIDLLKSCSAKSDDTSSCKESTCSVALKIGGNNSSLNLASKSTESSISLCATLNSINSHFRESFKESHDLFDTSYHLNLDNVCDVAQPFKNPLLESAEEACIDLVELEWNNLKFEPDFFLSNDVCSRNKGEEEEYVDDDEEDEEEEPQQVEYLMKVVEELQKENNQLRQKVERMSTTNK